MHLLKRRANIDIGTPFGNTRSFTTTSLVKQGTSLGSIPNNCSLDEVYAHSNSCQYGTVEIKALDFVDDIADANHGSSQAFVSHRIITDIKKENG